MVTINPLKVKEYHLFEILYEINNINEKLFFFNNRYGVSFPEFEDFVKKADIENFEAWEDYIQWKANLKHLEKMNYIKDQLQN